MAKKVTYKIRHLYRFPPGLSFGRAPLAVVLLLVLVCLWFVLRYICRVFVLLFVFVCWDPSCRSPPCLLFAAWVFLLALWPLVSGFVRCLYGAWRCGVQARALGRVASSPHGVGPVEVEIVQGNPRRNLHCCGQWRSTAPLYR